MPDVQEIEYPAMGQTYCYKRQHGVYRYDSYPEGSVLAGQERRRCLGVFPDLEAARAAFPSAHWSGQEGSGWRERPIPRTPPSWFDPSAIGESWDGE